MRKNNSPTIKQHYIPQYYLRGFSKDGNCVFQYDVNEMKQLPLTHVKEICFEKNLYEFYDCNNNIVARNSVENKLRHWESIFNNNIIEIKEKSQKVSKFPHMSFLSEKQMAVLIFNMAIQVLRMPNIIQSGTDIFLNMNKDLITSNQARNHTILECLPVHKPLDINENSILNTVIKWFENMYFCVGITEKSNIFTGDMPVVLYSDDVSKAINGEKKANDITYPLTSNLVLFMMPPDDSKAQFDNVLFKMSDSQVELAKDRIVSLTNRWIYSENELSEDDIRIIKKYKIAKKQLINPTSE